MKTIVISLFLAKGKTYLQAVVGSLPKKCVNEDGIKKGYMLKCNNINICEYCRQTDVIKSDCDHINVTSGMTCIGGRCNKCNEIV